MKRIRNLLLSALAVAMTLCLTLGIAACGEKTESVNYSVTVTCEDASVLEGVKVRLEGGGKKSEDKALSGGMAGFELEAGSYSVVLSGVPETYTYEQKTVTESAPDVTVPLTKKDDRPADGLYEYTVTVTCEDEDVLSAVKVRLMLGSAVAEEKPLTDGKAVFRLQPGDYTATLTGVPAGYTYEPKSLAGPSPAVTIKLTKVSSSADVTVKVAAGKDAFGNDRGETPLENASVKVYRSKTGTEPVASAVTDESGVAHFETLAAGSYLFNVNGEEFENVAVESNSATVTLHEKLGSKAAPFVWIVGENDLPFTQEVLEALDEDSIYYALTVKESGLYSFDADNYNALVTGGVFGEDELSGMDDHVTAKLTAGTVYTFACSSTGALAADGNFGYKVTVTKGDTKEGGSDAPAIPWTGSGTETDPYVIQTLKGSYRVQIKYENEQYTPVYFKYDETAAAKYAIYSSDKNFYLTVGDNHYSYGGSASTEQSLFETEADKGYVFVLSPYDDDGTASVTVSFTIGSYEGYIPKWKGSGVFSTELHRDDPFIIETLVDDYDVLASNAGVFFKYEATETKDYKIGLKGDVGFSWSVRNYNNGDPQRLSQVSVTKSKDAGFSLTAGTTYLFYLSPDYTGSGMQETFAVHVLFKIEEGTVAPTPPDLPGDGSASDPLKIDEIVGEHTLKISAAGLYYTFTPAQTGTYTFTAKSLLLLSSFKGSNGKTLAGFYGKSVGQTKDYELIAGIAYTFLASGYGDKAAEATEISFEVKLKSAAAEVVIPGEFDGTWKDVNGDYVLTIADGKLTLKKGDAPVETIVTAQASSAMEGKTSYYVTFEGKTYTLQWNSVGEKALQLYLNQSESIHFAPDPLPAFAFEAAQQGEYAARNGEFTQHIVVSASGIAWESHKIVLLSDMTKAYDGYDKAYAAYVDGKPELLLFGNNAIYFERSKLYFDNVAASETVTLPADFIGSWKSADGNVTLEVSANAVVLKENDVAADVSLTQKKVGSSTEYYLVWKGKDWEFATPTPGVLTLEGETKVHFAKDPLPTVDLTKYIGVYRCSISVDYLVVEKNAIKWGDRTVTLAAEPTATPYGAGYPFFADGKLYLFFLDMDGESLVLVNNDGGEDGELTRVGDTIPEADGSESKPFVLENFLGEQSFRSVPADGAYYAFELPFDATLVFTAGTANINVSINKTPWQPTRAGEQVNLKCPAGVVTLKLSGATEISLTIAMNYTVTVKSADKDVYGNTVNEAVKQGVSVMLVKGGQTVQTVATDSNGVATFSVTETGDYSVKIDNTEYSFTGASCAATLLSGVVPGSSPEHPLTLKMGANEFPLTQAIVTQYSGGVSYSFTCTYTGTYVFALSETFASFTLSDGGTSVVTLEGNTSSKAQLQKDKTYTATVLSKGTTEFAFTLTIGLDVGEIEGSGTKADPEVLRGFSSVARFTGTDANTAYYFSFLTDKNYSVVIKASKNCRIGGGLVGSTTMLSANGTVTVNLKKGVAADFYVMALLNEGADIIELSFTATEVADAPWDGSGTKEDPYRPENFVGEYELNGTANKYIYFEYTATKDTKYKVTYLGGVPLSFYLTNAVFEGTNKTSLSSSQTTGTFSLTSGTKLTFRIYPDQTGSLKFKIEEVN